jgi:hypothetical protein
MNAESPSAAESTKH